MKTKFTQLTYFILITLILSVGASVNAQTQPYRVSDRTVQTLLNRLENRTDTFRSEIDKSLDNSNYDGTRREDSINNMVADFETATDKLKNNFSDRTSVSSDVQDVLNRALYVNTFMKNNRVTTRAQSQWNQIRSDLTTLARYYNVRTNWNVSATYPGAVSPTGYNVSDAQLRGLLDRLNLRENAFRLSFDRWSNRGRREQKADVIAVSNDVTQFNTAIDNLRRNFDNRNSQFSNVDSVLNPSVSINNFIKTTRTNNDVTRKWNFVRDDLTTLARYYNMSWDWNNPVLPGTTYGTFDTRITGSYRLNSRLSDNVSTAVDAAMIRANYNDSRRDRIKTNLERRLRSPEYLSIDKRGQQVTISSSNAAAMTLNADNVNHREVSPNGKNVDVTVSSNNNDLTINYEGDRVNDFLVTFSPISNGQLRVNRRVYIEDKNETVSVTSVYDKTSQVPDRNIAVNPVDITPVNGFYVPNNTGIVATLNNPISTKTAKDGDRFSMTVTSPSQYRGAVIEGNVVGEKSGIFSGKANLSLNFETIRLRNGSSYRFAGIVDQVRHTNGDVIDVTNEGTVKDDSQTTKTITRAGIGAGIGALLGAIIGGGKGAAIGAGVGAGAGAGTVVLQGKDNLDLETGSQFTITATGPESTRSQ